MSAGLDERDTQACCGNQAGLLIAGAAGTAAFTPILDLLAEIGITVRLFASAVPRRSAVYQYRSNPRVFFRLVNDAGDITNKLVVDHSPVWRSVISKDGQFC